MNYLAANDIILESSLAVFAFLFGLAFGSFANVLIHRLPLEESIIKPSSHCPHCKIPIRFYDNIPVLSYIILGGKCRNCGVTISLRYPLIEILMGGLFLGLFFKFGLSWNLLFLIPFVFIMVVHGVIDYQHYLLLDSLNIAAGLPGIVMLILIHDLSLKEGIIGAVAGGGILLLIYLAILLLFKKEGMGQGDIKTAALIGLYLGPAGLIFTFIIASLLGIIFGVVKLLMGKGRMLPFGTMLALGAIIVVFAGEVIWNFVY